MNSEQEAYISWKEPRERVTTGYNYAIIYILESVFRAIFCLKIIRLLNGMNCEHALQAYHVKFVAIHYIRSIISIIVRLMWHFNLERCFQSQKRVWSHILQRVSRNLWHWPSGVLKMKQRIDHQEISWSGIVKKRWYFFSSTSKHLQCLRVKEKACCHFNFIMSFLLWFEETWMALPFRTDIQWFQYHLAVKGYGSTHIMLGLLARNKFSLAFINLECLTQPSFTGRSANDMVSLSWTKCKSSRPKAWTAQSILHLCYYLVVLGHFFILLAFSNSHFPTPFARTPKL